MSPEERQLLTDLFERVRGAANTPRDHDAEDLIAQKLREQPYAAYFLAQAVIVQDQALQSMTNRVHELEAQVEDLESQAGANRQQSTGFLGSLGSLFGSRDSTPQRSAPYDQREGRLYDDYRNQDRYRGRDYYDEPAPAPGPWGRSGATGGPWSQPPMGSSGGFLSGALTTAAGVAGGMLAADAVRDMFSSHNNNNLTSGLFGGTNTNPGETVVNNFFGDNDKNVRDNNKSDDRAGGDSASGSGFADNSRDNDNNDDYDVADDGDFGGSDDDSNYA